MFDYCAGSCIWGMNGEGLLSLEKFPISNKLKNKIEELSNEFDSILNWDDPAAGFVWSKEQIADFRLRANAVYDELVAALGEDYTVENWIDISLGIKK
ncbi:MAG: hypothetical protein J6B80_05245 [Clostridia bacterium]|nr:hypothetical protein [Clostridia bacterium]